MGNEEYACGKADTGNDVRDDSVLPDSVRHQLEYDDAHTQDDEIGNESKGVSEVVKFILNNKKKLLFFSWSR